MIFKRKTLAKSPTLIAVTVLACALTGCASEPRQPSLTADQWKNCADEKLMIAYTMSKAGLAPSKLLGDIAGQQIASECGTGGLNAAKRVAHILDTVKEMELDFAGFVRKLETRTDDAPGN